MAEKQRFIHTELKKMYLFGTDGAEKFIEKLGYDKSEWQELLDGMRAYANDDFYMDDPNAGLSPSEIFESCCAAKHNEGKMIQCRRGYIFSFLDVNGGFCSNCLECGFVKENISRLESEKQKKYYELYLRSDIDLLRVIDDTMRLYRGLVSYKLLDPHGPLLMDIAVTLNRREIVPLDKEFLSQFYNAEESYGQFIKPGLYDDDI